MVNFTFLNCPTVVHTSHLCTSPSVNGSLCVALSAAIAVSGLVACYGLTMSSACCRSSNIKCPFPMRFMVHACLHIVLVFLRRLQPHMEFCHDFLNVLEGLNLCMHRRNSYRFCLCYVCRK